MKTKVYLERESKKSWATKSINYTSQFLKETVMYVILCIIIFIIIIYPLLNLLTKSFDINVFISLFGDKSIYKSLSNTLIIGIGVTFFSILFGGSLAWLVVRTDFKYKKFIKIFALIGFMIPSYILSVSWIEIFSKNGYLSRLLKILFNYDYNFFPYSIISVILVLSIHLYPLAFMAISNALEAYSMDYEDAAFVCGANRKKIMKTITFPMIIPSILSIGILIFSRSMANFGVPAALCLPIGKDVVTTKIFSYLSHLELVNATVLSVILIIISACIYIINSKIISKRKYASSTNKKFRNPKMIKLGKHSKIVNFFAIAFCICVTGIPLVSIVITSFLKRWGLKIQLKNLTINNYITLFTNPYTNKSFLNSMVYGIVGATAAVIIGCLVLYLFYINKNKLTSSFMIIVTWPIAFPNIVLAVAATLSFINKPLKLYGTKWIIIITYIALFIPIAVKNMSGIIENIDKSLIKASRMSGASILGTLKTIIIPLIAPGMTSAWILCFLIALREIPISLLLYSSGTETLGVMLFTLQSNSYGLEMTSTLAVVIIIMSLIGNLIIKKVRRRSK
ncbi:iron ABC transporter permease [Vallitalea sediminicola]